VTNVSQSYAVRVGKLAGWVDLDGERMRRLEWADNKNLLITTSYSGAPPMVVTQWIGEVRELRLLNTATHEYIVLPNWKQASSPTRFVEIGQYQVRRLNGRTVLFLALRRGILRIDLVWRSSLAFTAARSPTRASQISRNSSCTSTSAFSIATGTGRYLSTIRRTQSSVGSPRSSTSMRSARCTATCGCPFHLRNLWRTVLRLSMQAIEEFLYAFVPQ
jgi:hypothetical protein